MADSGWYKAGYDWWNNELKKALGLQSGAITPQETPEFKGMQNALNSTSWKVIQQALSQGGKQGLTGGAMEQLLASQDEAGKANILKVIQDIYNQSYARSKDIAGNAGAVAMQVPSQQIENYTKLGSLEVAKDQLELQKKMAMMNSQMEASGGKCLSNTCMIFTEGWTRELELPVRRFRDEHYSDESYVAQGYKIMGNWLVPVVLKSKFIRFLIRQIMLHPMSKCATYHYKRDLKRWIYAPFGLFWTGFWDISARLKRAVS